MKNLTNRMFLPSPKWAKVGQWISGMTTNMFCFSCVSEGNTINYNTTGNSGDYHMLVNCVSITPAAGLNPVPAPHTGPVHYHSAFSRKYNCIEINS